MQNDYNVKYYNDKTVDGKRECSIEDADIYLEIQVENFLDEVEKPDWCHMVNVEVFTTTVEKTDESYFTFGYEVRVSAILSSDNDWDYETEKEYEQKQSEFEKRVSEDLVEALMEWVNSCEE